MNKNNPKHNKSAFTLAEVLITLVIIGVVASLTITVIQQVQYGELKTAFKKVYSDFGSATQRIMTENGGTMKAALTSSHTVSRDKYLQYMSYNKACFSADTSCGTDYCTYLNSIKLKNGTSNPDASLSGDCAGHGGGFAALNNGVFFTITSAWNGGNATTCSPYCAIIITDVNGFKGPNRWGRDIFGLYVYESAIKPFGSQGDAISGDPNYNDAAKVMREQSY